MADFPHPIGCRTGADHRTRAGAMRTLRARIAALLRRTADRISTPDTTTRAPERAPLRSSMAVPQVPRVPQVRRLS